MIRAMIRAICLALLVAALSACNVRLHVDKGGQERNFNPASIYPPFGQYSQGVKVVGDTTWLYAAGQVGVRPDGTPAEGFDGQAEQALHNVEAILREAGMEWPDVVRLNAFLTDRSNLGAWSEIRGRILGEARPAGTLLIVKALAGPQWLIEVEITAARR